MLYLREDRALGLLTSVRLNNPLDLGKKLFLDISLYNVC
jgi:hypothetical protein